MSNWNQCKNILIIRLDNMGDVLMTSPAIRAIKENLDCKITLLTSKMGISVANLISEIDEVIEFNSPWMKMDDLPGHELTINLIDDLQQRCFDGCVIFNVYSQNPLAAFMVAYLSKIPLRLGYCRENPYALLTDWIPDEEPFKIIRHQVLRDLDLVKFLGVTIREERIKLDLSESVVATTRNKVLNTVTNPKYILLHTGVSEIKRRYPKHLWVEIGKLLTSKQDHAVILTGSALDKEFAEQLLLEIGSNCYSFAGALSLEEFASLIKDAEGLISVNTGSIHLAAAFNTPQVVLYAQTNPQHAPWMSNFVMMDFSIPDYLRSKNQVIDWVSKKVYRHHKDYPKPKRVVAALHNLMLVK